MLDRSTVMGYNCYGYYDVMADKDKVIRYKGYKGYPRSKKGLLP